MLYHPLRWRHGDSENPSTRLRAGIIQCFAIFTDDEYLIRENRETPLEVRVEREERFCGLKISSFSMYSFKKGGVYFGHGISVGEINATLSFLL